MAQHRHAVGRGEEQDRYREVGWIPEMIVAIAEHVLRGDRQESAEREWPECGALRLGQQREADSTYVCALQVHDFAAIEPGEQRLRRHADAERDDETLVSAEHVIPELRGEQNEGDEKRDEISWIDAPALLPRSRDRSAPRHDRLNRLTHRQRGSVSVTKESIVGRLTTCTAPDGH